MSAEMQQPKGSQHNVTRKAQVLLDSAEQAAGRESSAGQSEGKVQSMQDAGRVTKSH